MLSLIASCLQDHSFSNDILSEPISNNHWELIGKRINGSFLSVYQARPKNRNINASYAFKTLQKKWQGTELGERILRNEICLGQSVFCPHILPVLDYRQSRIQYWKSEINVPQEINENSILLDCANEMNDFQRNESACFDNIAYWPGYFITPWLEGQTVQEQLTQKKRIDQQTVWKITRQTVKALDALNRQGWSHNDLKPSNIFVSSTGHVTLIDFGFASKNIVSFNKNYCSLSNNPIAWNFNDKTFSGTPFYLAPELLLESAPPDITSDFYSLGIIIFEMLTGKSHFNVFSWNDLYRKYETMKCCIENDLNRLCVSPQAIQLLQQLTAKKREKRPQTTNEILTALNKLEMQTFPRSPNQEELRQCA